MSASGALAPRKHATNGRAEPGSARAMDAQEVFERAVARELAGECC